MTLEPQKFFIGLMDFFSILLPGALLTYLIKDDAAKCFLGTEHGPLVGPEGWSVFLVSSYLLGHFLFLLGSWLLDDGYDLIRKASYASQVRKLSKGEELSGAFPRWLAARLFKKDVDEAVRAAVKIKDRHFQTPQASAAINTFQWCKARLTLEHGEALAAVQRFEADSKFFRSLVVALCFLIPWGLAKGRWGVGEIGVPGLALAYWRFADQRLKATNQAYWYIITLEGGGADAPPDVTPVDTHAPTHAGGVVYRTRNNQLQYLLVETKKTPKEWVLPKGHIEAEEPMKETAVREVREETGVWARVNGELGKLSYSIDGESIRVQYYLMEALANGRPSDKGREREWTTVDEVGKYLLHDQLRELVHRADRKLQGG